MSPESIADKYRKAVDRFLFLTTQMPPEMRSTPESIGSWSIQEILAHLTYWDANNVAILEADAAGLPYSLDEGNVDARNIEAVAERRDMSWDDLVLEVSMRRDHRCQLHLRPTDLDYAGAGDHWDEHRAEIEDHLRQLDKTHGVNRLSPGQISDQYAERSRIVIELAESVQEEQRLEPGVCGEWSLKDVLSHLAFWDYVTCETLTGTVAAGDTLTDADSVDSINNREVQRRSAWSWEAVLAELTSYRERRISLHLLPVLSDMSDVGEHWIEHGSQIEAWLSDHTGGG